MDLLLIKLERVDNDFHESLIKFISDHGYKPKVIAHNPIMAMRLFLRYKICHHCLFYYIII